MPDALEPFRLYLKANFSASFLAWDRAQSKATFVSLLISAAIALLGGRYVFGLTAEDWPKILGFFVVVEMAVVTPYRLWRKQRERIGELEDKLRPVLRVDFVPGEFHYETTNPKHADGNPALRTFRIKVTNVGPSPLLGCSVRLVSLIDKNGVYSREVNRPFRLMRDQPSNPMIAGHQEEFALAPDGFEYVDIVAMDERNESLNMQFLYALRPDNESPWVFINVEKGPQILTIDALGGPKALRRRFKIYGDENGFLKMEDLDPPSIGAALGRQSLPCTEADTPP